MRVVVRQGFYCNTYNFYCIIVGFLNPENMGVDAKIVFLSDLEANILPKT